MATRSTAMLNEFADAWEDDLDYPSAVLSGIVGDARHRAQGGYHISIEDNPAGNYSIVRADDKAPPGTWPRDRAAAVDMSMSKADMIKTHRRVHAVWKNHNDPRRKFFNAFNVWDGSGDAVRLDFVTNRASFATADHKWHNHGEFRRRYVNSAEAKRAALSMLAGESVTQYLGSSDTSVPVPSGSPLLRVGSTGTRVRQLQNALNEATDAGLKVDGDFGTATESAVKTFQRSAGLDDDGIYGSNTAAALREELSDMPLTKADVNLIFNTDNIIKAPTSAASHETNTHWTASSYLASIRNYAVAAADRAGEATALAAVAAGKDVTAAVRAELTRHRALLVTELEGSLGPAVLAGLREHLDDVADERLVAAAAAGTRRALGSLDEAPAGDGR